MKTGMRLGELRGLRWGDCDLVAGTIRVQRNLVGRHEGTPKNGKARTVDLSVSAVAALKAHRHLRGERVFCNLDGKDYTLGEWRYWLKRCCLRAGLRVIGWHTLRHTFASHLVGRGATITVIKELLGHGTLQVTMRTHTSRPERLEQQWQDWMNRPCWLPCGSWRNRGASLVAAAARPATRFRASKKA
jgi:integrase